jgi:hypothetical protein
MLFSERQRATPLAQKRGFTMGIKSETGGMAKGGNSGAEKLSVGQRAYIHAATALEGIANKAILEYVNRNSGGSTVTPARISECRTLKNVFPKNPALFVTLAQAIVKYDVAYSALKDVHTEADITKFLAKLATPGANGKNNASGK